MSDSVESFSSWEEMQRVLGEREDQANAGLLPAQIELRDDTENTRYWVRPYPQANCLIFGEAWSFNQFCDVSSKYVDDLPMVNGQPMFEAGAEVWASYRESLSESVYEIRAVAESRTRGYLRGIAYSIIEPDGEHGSTHVSNVYPISKEAFEEARASGWRAVDVDRFDLALMGEEAARKGGWTPTLVAEMRAIDKVVREVHYG